MSERLQRLGRNVQGYGGETIDITAVLNDCLAAARAHGWSIEELPAGPSRNLLALTRAQLRLTDNALRAPNSVEGGSRIYISTGIHGDEPAGPLAVRQLLRDNQWLEESHLFLCPCLNPTGFALNRRENAE